MTILFHGVEHVWENDSGYNNHLRTPVKRGCKVLRKLQLLQLITCGIDNLIAVSVLNNLKINIH